MPIIVGGDDSVKWKVDVTKAREAHGDPLPGPLPPPGRVYSHWGVDHTRASPTEAEIAHDFLIIIDVPTYPNTVDARDALADGLSAALAAVRDGKKAVYFRMPVQDRAHGGPNEDQIRIRWARASAANARGGEYTDSVPE